MPLSGTEEAIKNIAVPRTKAWSKRFIGLNNNYSNMWQHRFKIWTPLWSMTSDEDK